FGYHGNLRMPKAAPQSRPTKRIPENLMPKHIVCLTFDFDAMSGFISRGMTSPSPVSRGEFGPDVAAPRILALLRKYRIPTSWYIPGHTLQTYPNHCFFMLEAAYELGHHGW